MQSLEVKYCEECEKPSDAPLCWECINALFEDWDKDTPYGGENVEVIS